MKLVKGSAEAKRYMASIRAKKKISGNDKKQFYIEFLNKDKEFKKDIKYFNTFQLAKNWALKTFDKFDIDVIKENNMKKLGSVKASKELKKTLKAKKLYMPHGYKTAKRKRKIGEVHTDTKSHNVKINVLSGIILTADEKKFLISEGKKSKGFKYRAKVLWGDNIVLKEKENGTPVQKFIVDSYELANYLSKELNKNQNLTKVKGKLI